MRFFPRRRLINSAITLTALGAGLGVHGVAGESTTTHELLHRLATAGGRCLSRPVSASQETARAAAGQLGRVAAGAHLHGSRLGGVVPAAHACPLAAREVGGRAGCRVRRDVCERTDRPLLDAHPAAPLEPRGRRGDLRAASPHCEAVCGSRLRRPSWQRCARPAAPRWVSFTTPGCTTIFPPAAAGDTGCGPPAACASRCWPS